MHRAWCIFKMSIGFWIYFYLSIYLLIYLFNCLFIYLFIHLFIYLFIYLFIHLFIYLCFTYLFIYFFVFITTVSLPIITQEGLEKRNKWHQIEWSNWKSQPSRLCKLQIFSKYEIYLSKTLMWFVFNFIYICVR